MIVIFSMPRNSERKEASLFRRTLKQTTTNLSEFLRGHGRQTLLHIHLSNKQKDIANINTVRIDVSFCVPSVGSCRGVRGVVSS